jgi:hypothetical protein
MESEAKVQQNVQQQQEQEQKASALLAPPSSSSSSSQPSRTVHACDAISWLEQQQVRFYQRLPDALQRFPVKSWGLPSPTWVVTRTQTSDNKTLTAAGAVGLLVHYIHA